MLLVSEVSCSLAGFPVDAVNSACDRQRRALRLCKGFTHLQKRQFSMLFTRTSILSCTRMWFSVSLAYRNSQEVQGLLRSKCGSVSLQLPCCDSGDDRDRR